MIKETMGTLLDVGTLPGAAVSADSFTYRHWIMYGRVVTSSLGTAAMKLLGVAFGDFKADVGEQIEADVHLPSSVKKTLMQPPWMQICMVVKFFMQQQLHGCVFHGELGSFKYSSLTCLQTQIMLGTVASANSCPAWIKRVASLYGPDVMSSDMEKLQTLP
ncbi:hypothetical protein Dimus_035547 [Dionaea muscipula]